MEQFLGEEVSYIDESTIEETFKLFLNDPDATKDTINMCEIKFYGNDFSVSKDYHKTLINRQELLSKELSPKVNIHNTLITTYGLKDNEYSSDFDSVITLDNLFAE